MSSVASKPDDLIPAGNADSCHSSAVEDTLRAVPHQVGRLFDCLRTGPAHTPAAGRPETRPGGSKRQLMLRARHVAGSVAATPGHCYHAAPEGV